jgi:hypothetical protein
MKSRWLIPLGVLLAVTALARGQGPRTVAALRPSHTVGYLGTAAPLTDAASPQTAPYEPRPGDIVLYDDFNKFHHFVFKLAHTSSPTHVAMVVARADGTPALLDLTGPRVITAKVCIIDLETRFKNYKGVIMVRRIREPLTPEHSRDLTRFAESESGKSFALGRVMLQATPFCPRTGLRRELFGRTFLTRDRWFCSELVVAGGAAAHVFDPNRCCANATYPRDLAFDETLDLSRAYHPPVFWSPAALARAR